MVVWHNESDNDSDNYKGSDNNSYDNNDSNIFSFDVAGALADLLPVHGTDLFRRPHQPEPAHVRLGMDMPHQ